MADLYDPLPDLADLLNVSVNMDCAPAAYRLARKLRITPETGSKQIETRLRDALGLTEPAAVTAGDELRIRIHAHLRKHPDLTAFEIARVLRLENPRHGGQSTVRRLLVRMEADGEAERSVGPKDDGDRRPTARWRAT